MIVHDVIQGSVEWYQLRAGKPTASEFSNVITSTGKPSDSLKSYSRMLAAELYAGKPLETFEGNFWTRRGRELEPEAANQYAFIKNVEPEIVGFVTDDLERYGCSPDRLVGADGSLEIKCLKTEQHVAIIQYVQRNKKAPSDYIPQTQGQLLVCERAWSDLFFYHPDLPPVIVRQERDQGFLSLLKAQLSLVLAERDKVLEAIKAA